MPSFLARIPRPAGPPLPGLHQPLRRRLDIRAIRVAGEEVPVGMRDLMATPFCTLKGLCRADRTDLPRLLVVAPISGHYPIVLRDMLIGLLESHEILLTDWHNVRHVPVEHGPFGMVENIDTVLAFLRRAGGPVGLVGTCQGAVPAFAAACHLAARGEAATPPALVLMGAPIDPMAAPTRLVRELRRRPMHWFEHVPLLRLGASDGGRGRWVYPARLHLGALTAYLWRKLAEGGELRRKFMSDDGADPARFPFLDLYSSVMDLDADFFVENVRLVYQSRVLAAGGLEVEGAPLCPEALNRTALMTVEGAEDDIAAPGQTAAAHRLCPGVPEAMRARAVIPDSAHFGLFHGETCRREVLPRLAEFLGTHLGATDEALVSAVQA